MEVGGWEQALGLYSLAPPPVRTLLPECGRHCLIILLLCPQLWCLLYRKGLYLSRTVSQNKSIKMLLLGHVITEMEK